MASAAVSLYENVVLSKERAIVQSIEPYKENSRDRVLQPNNTAVSSEISLYGVTNSTLSFPGGALDNIQSKQPLRKLLVFPISSVLSTRKSRGKSAACCQKRKEWEVVD